MWEILYVPLTGALDRLRGDRWPVGWGGAKKLLLGFSMGLAMGFTEWVLLLAAILSAFSFANGWGSPLGAALGKHKNMPRPYETWQTDWFGNILREDPYVAMAFRGIIASLFLLPLMYWNTSIVCMVPLMAMCYSVPTLWINKWEVYEFIRGCSIGLSCLLINFLG